MAWLPTSGGNGLRVGLLDALFRPVERFSLSDGGFAVSRVQTRQTAVSVRLASVKRRHTEFRIRGMEIETDCGVVSDDDVTYVELTSEEERRWSLLVEEGRVLRVGSRNLINDGSPEWVKAMSRKDSMKSIPIPVKRWVLLRADGMKFSRASAASGASWSQIQEARYRSEEMRCAMDAMDEHSRQLMKAKAQSVIEQSQDEDAKVSMAQTQVSMKILSSLDVDHFGERRETAAEEVQRAIGGGGFVINLIGDAAKVAEAVPEKRPGKALVFTDV